MVKMPVEILDHTADLRIRVIERDKKILYLRLGNAMIDLIFDNPSPSCNFFYRLEFDEKDAVTYLNDLLYELERTGNVLRIKCIEIIHGKIRLWTCGEEFDVKRHHYHYLIKAATYHRFMETESLVEITFDI